MKNLYANKYLYEETLSDFRNMMIANDIGIDDIAYMLSIEQEVVSNFIYNLDTDKIRHTEKKVLTMFMTSMLAMYNAGVNDHDKFAAMGIL